MSQTQTSTIIEVKDLSKSFEVGDTLVPVLKDINLELYNGDFLIIFGPSGSGKSTLLHTLLGLEPPTKGLLKFLGFDFYKMSPDDRADFRKKHVGIIYQQSYWLKSLDVLENVSFPLLLNGRSLEEAQQIAMQRLEQVGMQNWAHYLPSELSAGMQQKVGLARSLVTNPLIIVADEPTGNLDTKSGTALMEHLQELNQKHKKTVVMVTHDLEYLKYATRVAEIVDGKINRQAKKGTKDWKQFVSLRGKKTLAPVQSTAQTKNKSKK